MTTTAMRSTAGTSILTRTATRCWSRGRPSGKEGILGECNIGWTPVQDDWNAGHVRDMGGSMALLNAMLEMIGDGRYSRIVTWPSHYPSKASISGCPENAFGWFDLDQWYLEGKDCAPDGPGGRAQDRQPECSGKPAGRVQQRGEKVRVYAYCNAAQTDLRVIVLNKWDATQLTLNVPEQMDCVSAMVLSGESVWDTAPEYRSLFAGCEAVTGGSYTGGIPGESVVVATFSPSRRESARQPELLSPGNGAGGAGTAQAFAWTPVDGGRNTALPYRPTQTFPHP